MAGLNELIWQHIDARAIAGSGGLATIEQQRHAACHNWLSRNGYSFTTLDCSRPLDEVAAELYRMVRWDEQFGSKDPAR